MGVFLDEANSFYSNLHPNPDYTFLLFFRIEVYIFCFYLSQNDVFDEASQMSIPYLNFLHHQQYWKPFWHPWLHPPVQELYRPSWIL